MPTTEDVQVFRCNAVPRIQFWADILVQYTRPVQIFSGTHITFVFHFDFPAQSMLFLSKFGTAVFTLLEKEIKESIPINKPHTKKFPVYKQRPCASFKNKARN